MTATLKATAMLKRRPDAVAIGLRVWGIIVFVFLFLPIIVMIVYSFNTGRLLASWEGFGFDAYEAALANPIIRGSIITSITAAVGAAILSTALGTLGGIALARSRVGSLTVIVATGLLAITLFTPEIVDAVAMLPWFVTLGTDAGLGAFNIGLVRLVTAHAVLSVAVVTFIVRARMAGLDASLEEAAADLYATPFRRFTQITLPIASPAIWAGALMSFTLSLDNTIVSSFIQVPGSTPFPVYIFSALRVGLRPEIAAVSTAMFLLTLLALAVVAMVLRRGNASTEEIARTLAG
ncbi:ABC transporter permease [Leifsonia sp. A12D58]|uniref:ABC transporter permease n=1 Tax=Leifsonia sp. A12D58 TaxID=3397674 RepID=UPI0039DFF952